MQMTISVDATRCHREAETEKQRPKSRVGKASPWLLARDECFIGACSH